MYVGIEGVTERFPSGFGSIAEAFQRC